MEAGVESPSGAPPPLRLAAFDYALPPELIAQEPAPARDAARLLVLDRARDVLAHSVVRELPQWLRAGDLLVLNDTRVRPARLFGRTSSGGAVELLLLTDVGGGIWHGLGKPAKRLKDGTRLLLAGGVEAIVTERFGGGRYAVAFPPSLAMSEFLARHGELPLPPYVRRPDGAVPVDRERYQTVFAVREGAVAAPTAGLHFTLGLLDALRAAGVELAWLTLHVGPGTFLPVREDDVSAHHMEPEWAEIAPTTAAAIGKARREGRRVVAVGTTTTRALESAAARTGAVVAGSLWADRFVLPGFRFRVVDALLTNFHLPRSTLLMLVSGFAGRDRILAAYAEAVRQRYRFYSYGDAMLIV